MRHLILSICFCMTALLGVTAPSFATAALDYLVFDNCPMTGAYFYSETASGGASWLLNLGGKIPVRNTPAYTAGSSLELRYVSAPGGTWRATILHRPIRGQDDWDNGVFIQSKASVFKRPVNLQLQLHCGSVPAESLPKIAILSNDNKTSTFVSLSAFKKTADNDDWSQVTIPLTEFHGLKLEVAEQLRGVVLEQDKSDGIEHTIYLDQVRLAPDKDKALNRSLRAELLSAKGFERHIDISWKAVKDESVAGTIIERSSAGSKFTPVGFKPRFMSRFADYLGPDAGKQDYRICFLGYNGERSDYSNIRSASTRAMSDDELLDMVQEACSRYYFDGAEEFSGMALESIPGDPHMIACGASGFGLMSLLVAAKRGFISRNDAVDRFEKILDFLRRADRFHGAMPHYYDGTSGHPKLFFGPDDNGGDLVETSFLMQGLLTARQYFDGTNPREKRIREQITQLWEAVEWDWYKMKADSHYLYWHWSPDKAFKIQHPLIGWNETMITYMLAIASPKHAIAPSMYYSGFASQEKAAQEYRGNAEGKMYVNGESYYGKKLAVGGFSGGPIFFTHYNFLGMDPHGLRDRYTDYFENSKAIAEINRRYCQANPKHHQGYGDDGWGLSASDGPWGYNPDEPRPEGDKGKLTPTGAIASMPYLPEAAMETIKSYYRNYGSFLWGEYGFRDAFSLDEHWVNDLYMGLNQGPMVVMIENYRTGAPWKLFGSNPEIVKMRRKLFGAE